MRHNHTYPALLALMLTATLAGCQQDPLPETDAIRFSVASATVETTKADDPNVESYLIADGKAIKVWGSFKEGEDWTDVFVNKPETVTCSKPDGGIASWSYENTRYWNRNASYRFRAAYAPGHESDIQAASASDKALVSYSMTNSQGYDLMVASTPEISALTQVTSGNPAVNLTFRHAGSAVRFLFYKADSDANDYAINHFELKYLYTAATLEYSGTGTTAAPASPEVAISEWKLGNTPARTASAYAWTATDADPSWPVPTATTGAGAVNDREWFFVIPQALDNTDGDASLYFSFTVGTGTNAQLMTVTLDLEKYGTTPTSVTWEPGRMYTYRIQIAPKDIKFTVAWTDWVNGKEGDFNYSGWKEL